jgi:hypothetical protein
MSLFLLWNCNTTYLLRERQQLLLAEESVKGSIAVTLSSHETGDSEGGSLSSEDTLLINLSHVDLNRSMILSVEDSVSSRALSGHVQVNELSLIVLLAMVRRVIINKTYLHIA